MSSPRGACGVVSRWDGESNESAYERLVVGMAAEGVEYGVG